MRVLHDPGAALRQPRPEIRSLVSREPQRVRRNGGIRPADHLELEVGDNRVERHRRMLEKVAGAIAAGLFAAEPGEEDRPFRPASLRQCLGQLQHRHRSRGVVVRAVENGVGRGRAPVRRRAAAQVIEMCREQDHLGRSPLVAPRNPADGVPGVGDLRRLDLRRQRDGGAGGEGGHRRIGCLVEEHRARSRRRGRDAFQPRGQAREPGCQDRPAGTDLGRLGDQDRGGAGARRARHSPGAGPASAGWRRAARRRRPRTSAAAPSWPPRPGTARSSPCHASIARRRMTAPAVPTLPTARCPPAGRIRRRRRAARYPSGAAVRRCRSRQSTRRACRCRGR